MSEDASSWLLSALGISATFGRIIMGYAADKYGVLKIFRINLGIMIIANIWWILIALGLISKNSSIQFWLLLIFEPS